MKKQTLKNVLQLSKSTIINFENRQRINGGIEKETGDSCMKVCETLENQRCSYGA